MDIVACPICSKIISYAMEKTNERFNFIEELKKDRKLREWKKSSTHPDWPLKYQDPNLDAPKFFVKDFEEATEKNRRYLKPHLEFLSQNELLKFLGRKKGYIFGKKIYHTEGEIYEDKKLSKMFSKGGLYSNGYSKLLMTLKVIFDELWKYRSEDIHWYTFFDKSLSGRRNIDEKRKCLGRLGLFGKFDDKKLYGSLEKMIRKYNISIIVYNKQ
jgi:hypothetical protein